MALTRLEALRAEETQVASELTEHRQRLNELRRLLESSEAYGGAMRIQRDRLALAAWLRGLVEAEAGDPVAQLTDGGRDRILTLCDGLDALEVRLRSYPTISDTLDKEVLRQRAAAELVLQRLNEIRVELASLQRRLQVARETDSRFDRTERFLGRLEQALQLYDRADQSSGLRDEIAGLRSQIDALQRVVSESEIRRKLNNALGIIESTASRLFHISTPNGRMRPSN